MDIMELGAIGELVGGVAVIASLLYVGLQVRQNTAATRAASHHAITDSFNQINMAIARDDELAEMWIRGGEDRSNLTTPAEHHQYDMLALAMLRIFETLFYQSTTGTGEKRLLLAEERSLKTMFSRPGLREWWSSNPYSLDIEFRRFVENLMSEAAEGA